MVGLIVPLDAGVVSPSLLLVGESGIDDEFDVVRVTSKGSG